MQLHTLATSAKATVLQSQSTSLEITGITCDSRMVKAGDLFAALPGAKSDGSIYARQAAERGAAAILCEKQEPLTPLPQLVCADARLGLAQAARAFYGFPDRQLKMGAVTGTNGKSTTAYLVRHLLRTAGKKCGMLGTIEYDLGSQVIEAPLTTPESLDLHRYLKTMADAGCQAAMMETSSHSLCQHRVAGIDFAVGVFTNLTQDHLDYHRTMEEYREAKSILFRNLSPNATAVLNLDDPASAYFAGLTNARILGFSVNSGNGTNSCVFEKETICGSTDSLRVSTPPTPPFQGGENKGRGVKRAEHLSAQIISMNIHGTQFRLNSPWGARTVNWGLVGAHNIQNCLGALGAAIAMGIEFDDAVSALSAFPGVPGRLESVGDAVPSPLPFRVLVDYAHTDDALRSVMRALRELKPSRLIVAFGCGGDRDRTKRPKMGKAVEEMADLGIITSDSPLTEDPQAIIADICKGIQSQQKFIVEPDRAKAIQFAINEARTGDVVLIAGKGHENYQIFGAKKHHFSDVEQAMAAMKSRGQGSEVRGQVTARS